MLERIGEMLKVREGERVKVALMAAYGFLAISTFITGRISRDALFLREFDRTMLAYMYITVAVAVPVPAYLYGRVADRFRRDKIVLTTLGVLIAVLIVNYAFVVAGQRWSLIFLYNFIEVLGAFLMIQYWTFAGDIFASREAKRLFPVIGGGGVLAGILCGVSVGNFGRAYGPETLLPIMVGLMLLCMGIVARLGREERTRLKEAIVGRAARKERTGFKVRDEVSDVFHSKHLRIIAGMTVATFVTVPLIDYQFKVLAKTYFTIEGAIDEAALTHFFGLFYTGTGIIAAIMQFGIAGRLLERFGVVPSLMVLPISLLVGSLGTLLSQISALASSLFAVSVFTKGSENSFRYSIYDATMQVIYTPVPGHVRGRAKTFIDGILKPWAGGLAGAVIAVCMGPLGLEVSALSVVAVVFIAAWLVLILAIQREYVAQLLATLRRRRLNPDDNALTISDEQTVAILKRALASSDASEVRNAVALADRVVNQDLSEDLVALLKREEPDIRVRALQLLSRNRTMRYTDQIQACFDDASEEVRASAVRAYCAAVGEPALRVVQSHLKSDAPQVRGAAVASLIRHGGLEGILMSAEHLKLMQTSDNEEVRLAAAHVFREIGVKNFYQPVLALMRDKSLRVQNAAITAAGAMKSPELIPALIYKLARRETARSAAHALSQYGADVAPTLGKVLTHEPEDVAIRRQIPRILERIGRPECLDILLGALNVKDPDTRREAARTAARLRDRLGITVDEERVRKLILDEVREYYQLLVALDDLSQIITGTQGPDLLRDALEERLHKSLDRVFRLLGIIYPLRAVELVYSNLQSSAVTLRSNAVEVLDNVIDKDLKQSLLPCIEDMPRDQVIRRGTELFTLTRRAPEAWVEAFLDSDDSWLVVVALFVIRELGLTDVTDKVVRHLGHSDAVTRETALGTLGVLVDLEELWRFADELCADPNPRVRAFADYTCKQTSRALKGADSPGVPLTA